VLGDITKESVDAIVTAAADLGGENPEQPAEGVEPFLQP